MTLCSFAFDLYVFPCCKTKYFHRTQCNRCYTLIIAAHMVKPENSGS